MNKEWILDLYYSTKGDLDQINAALDREFMKIGRRKISLFEKLIKGRLSRDAKVLKMAKMEISPEEAIYLSLYPPLNQLEVLDLRKNLIGDDGIMAFAQSPVLKNLREMDLRNNHISRAGLVVFAESENFSRLEKLDLRINRLSGNWGEKLKGNKNFPGLKYAVTR